MIKKRSVFFIPYLIILGVFKPHFLKSMAWELKTLDGYGLTPDSALLAGSSRLQKLCLEAPTPILPCTRQEYTAIADLLKAACRLDTTESLAPHPYYQRYISQALKCLPPSEFSTFMRCARFLALSFAFRIGCWVRGETITGFSYTHERILENLYIIAASRGATFLFLDENFTVSCDRELLKLVVLVDKLLEVQSIQDQIVLPYSKTLWEMVFYCVEIIWMNKQLKESGLKAIFKEHLKLFIKNLTLKQFYLVLQAADFLQIDYLIKSCCKFEARRLESFVQQHSSKERSMLLPMQDLPYALDNRCARLILESRDIVRFIVAKQQMRQIIGSQNIHTSQQSVCHITASPDKTRIIITYNSMVKIWDHEAKKLVHSVDRRSSNLRYSAISGNHKYLAMVGNEDTIMLWDIEKSRVIARLQGHTGAVARVLFSNNSRYIVSGGSDATVRIWELASKMCHFVCRGHGGAITDLAFSPQEDLLASASEDSYAILWLFPTGSISNILIGHMQGLNAIAFNPQGDIVATTGQDCTLYLWNPENGQPLRIFSTLIKSAQCLTWSPGGSMLALAMHAEIFIWDSQTGERLATLRGHENNITSLLYIDNGTKLLTTDSNGVIKLWYLMRDREYKELLTTVTREKAAFLLIWFKAFRGDQKIVLKTINTLFASLKKSFQKNDAPSHEIIDLLEVYNQFSDSLKRFMEPQLWL